MKIKAKSFKFKYTKEELQEYLKVKRGTGSHKSIKDYKRNGKHKKKYVS